MPIFSSQSRTNVYLIAVCTFCALIDGSAVQFPLLPVAPSFAAETPAAPAEAVTPVSVSEAWEINQISGQRVGFGSTIEKVFPNGDIETTETSEMLFKRLGQLLRIKAVGTQLTGPNGELRQFRLEIANPPASTTVTTGVVRDGKLELESIVNGKSSKKTTDWQPGTQTQSWLKRELRTKPLAPGEKRSVQAFFPEFSKSGKATLETIGSEETTLADGKSATLQKIKSTQSIIPGLAVYMWVDDQGAVQKSVTNAVGLELVSLTVAKDIALQQLAGSEFDLAAATLVRVNDCTPAIGSKTARYRLRHPTGDLASWLPDDRFQQIKIIDPQTVEVTVTSAPLEKGVQPGKGTPASLESSPYLQSDDERVIGHAKRAIGSAVDASEIAASMSTYVHRQVQRKNFSTTLASAGEVAKTLEGDCTEHAVLLAAMLRVARIPSRVAIGLVYVPSERAFGGHMWTEALLGNDWYPLDAVTGSAGAKCHYIKFSSSYLDEVGSQPSSLFNPMVLTIGQLEIKLLSTTK